MIKYILFLFIILNLILGYSLFKLNKSSINVISIEKIDSLEQELSNLEQEKQKTLLKVDTVYLLMNISTKEYEEERNIIITNTVDSNYEFFSNYIRERFDSTYNK